MQCFERVLPLQSSSSSMLVTVHSQRRTSVANRLLQEAIYFITGPWYRLYTNARGSFRGLLKASILPTRRIHSRLKGSVGTPRGNLFSVLLRSLRLPSVPPRNEDFRAPSTQGEPSIGDFREADPPFRAC